MFGNKENMVAPFFLIRNFASGKIKKNIRKVSG